MAEGENEKDEAELEGGRMPFLKHLVELRDRLRNAALAFVAAFLVCWYFAGEIYAWLQTPLFNIWNTHCNINMQELWHQAFGSTIPQSLSDVYNRFGAGDAWSCTAHGLAKAASYGAPRLNYFGLTQPFWVDMSIGLWVTDHLLSAVEVHRARALQEGAPYRGRVRVFLRGVLRVRGAVLLLLHATAAVSILP